jgi:hypothetical protein
MPRRSGSQRALAQTVGERPLATTAKRAGSRLLAACCGVSLVAIALALCACGSTSTVKSPSTTNAKTVRAAPAFRVGQYCTVTKEASYRAAGLRCRNHHLAKP